MKTCYTCKLLDVKRIDTIAFKTEQMFLQLKITTRRRSSKILLLKTCHDGYAEIA